MCFAAHRKVFALIQHRPEFKWEVYMVVTVLGIAGIAGILVP